MPENVFELSVDGISYRMLLPNADVDYIQRKLATEHTPYELPMLEDMRSRLAAGDLVVDAGANIGNHTMYLAAVAGCRVVAFEPNGALASALRSSRDLNALDDKIDVRELGLGKQASRGHFAKDIPDNLGAQSITSGDGPLEIVTLDSIAFAGPVKAIKIDVEGMELDVLEGAVGLIGRDRPVVYVECADQVGFRHVHQWLAERNYGYWDTFNATPTHLFIPNERTSVDQRLARLQLKGAQDIYQLQQQVSKTREMLDSANLKYRAANELITNLKVQLAQQEAARQKAEHTAGDAQAQLVQTRERLEAERTALQREVQRLSPLAESQRDAVHQAEKQLVRVEAALDIARSKAEQDNALSKTAAESAARSNAQLVETQTRLLEERQVLVGQIEKLRFDWQQASNGTFQAEKQLALIELRLQAEKDALARANDKHLEATTQIAALKQRLSQEEQAARGAERLWGETQVELLRLKDEFRAMTASHQAATRQVGDLKTHLERELEARREVEQKEAQGRAALDEALQQHAAAEADLAKVQSELHATAERHRSATERVADLGRQLEEADKVAAERVTDLGRRLDEANKLAAERITDLNRQLNEANLKYRRVNNEEIPQLKARIQSSQAQAHEHKQHFEQMKLELLSQKKTLKEVSQQLERARVQKIQAEQQVVKTRASLSFQLGYILINGFKSFRGFVGIPGALLAWRKDVVKRRKQKAQRLEKLQPVAMPPVPVRVAPTPAPQTGADAVAAAVPAGGAAPAAVAVPPVRPAAAGTRARDLRQLKVACIMDEFTFGSYRAECELFQLTPAGWRNELEGFQPELLFIESAWRGKDELWGSKVGHRSQELQGIVAWCRQHRIPTVFWNKEDPVHFETFLSTAMLFDCVFTTDIDCIHRYKAALGHDNVFLLPFACQPKNHHPIETYDRKDAFCFAGAYYVRYPERTRDLGNFVAELPSFRPVEIYDRNFGKDDPNYQFPPEYQPYIVGTLPFDQIDKAYKGYRYAINLNSIKQSQTMFARRVFELMASNTITVSNFSRGVRLLFGDLVVTTDSGAEMVRHLNAVAGDPVRAAKLRLAALRKVLQEHTYGQRLAYVASKALGRLSAGRLPKIAVLAYASDASELEWIVANALRQTYAHCDVHVVLASGVAADTPADGRLRFIAHADAAGRTIADLVGDADFVAGMLARDYYGPNYLLDIALATTYANAEVIGKNAHYAWEHRGGEGAIGLHAAGTTYRPARRFALRHGAVRLARLGAADVTAWLDTLSSAALETEHGLAIDEFNYCRDALSGADVTTAAAAVDDLPGLDTGMPIAELLRMAESIPPAPEGAEGGQMISGRRLAQSFGKGPSAALRLDVDGDHWRIGSSLADGKHEYFYATEEYALADLGWTGKAEFYFDITPGLNLQLVLVFLDAQKQKIAHAIKPGNRNQEVEIPLGTVSVRFGLRVHAAGSSDIKGLVLGHRDLQPAEIIGKSDRLLLTNHYPSYDDLYRNGFVHSRVRAYRERGIRCDVFRMRPGEPVSYHEFEDVDVTTGSQEVLHQMLSSGRYKTVMVHFLEPAMWEVLQHHIDRVKVVVWVHGAEIQPWHRRDYNYANEEERTVAKMKSAARTEFWHGVLRPMPANLKLVFVSRYFAEEVMEDLGFRIPESQYTIIHNPIDTDVFDYRPKSSEQRKMVLSIRPYASAKYANDLSVQAILLLAEKPWFHEMEFKMVGDGQLFDTILEPLRRFPNVSIERRFLKQAEIAALHKDYGIFLSPTRMDAQGVSRDEAMASGLVPVTNGVTAIPEFVDEACGILAPGEDAAAMADGIVALYENPDRFLAMSRNARLRVERQSAKDTIVNAEIEVMQ
jgi:FkbM family methyltransferase